MTNPLDSSDLASLVLADWHEEFGDIDYASEIREGVLEPPINTWHWTDGVVHIGGCGDGVGGGGGAVGVSVGGVGGGIGGESVEVLGSGRDVIGSCSNNIGGGIR